MSEKEKITLRTVQWINMWQRITAMHSDGYGTKTHLTVDVGYAGKTLCGKWYPANKGIPSSWGAGYCKRCLKKAYAMGFQQGFVRDLDCVGSKPDVS